MIILRKYSAIYFVLDFDEGFNFVCQKKKVYHVNSKIYYQKREQNPHQFIFCIFLSVKNIVVQTRTLRQKNLIQIKMNTKI